MKSVLREPILIARIASLPFERIDSSARATAEIELVNSLWERVDAAAAALEDALFAAAGPAEDSANTLHAPSLSSDDGRTTLAAVPARTLLLQTRRAVHHRRGAMLAAAARDLEEQEPALARSLADFVALLDRLDQAMTSHRAAHSAAVALGAQRLLTALDEPILEEGLRLVSRSLFEKARRLDRVPFAEWKHRERHTALKLAAYLARATSKTSPNGVFCATALGRLGERAACRGECTLVAREVLVAVGEARKVTACLAVDPEFAPLVVPRPNPTLREHDSGWTFWRPASPRREDDQEVRSAARIHPVARAMLESCAPNRPMPELVDEVSRRTGISVEQLETFARSMVETGLLIAEVEIPWSERRPLRRLAEMARDAGCAGKWAARAQALERAVDQVSGTPWPERRSLLEGISESIESLPHRRPLHHDELIRVDAASAMRIELPTRVVADLERFMSWYAQLYAAIYPRQRFIEGYARRFLALHPPDTDVDLLDLYHGVFEPRGEARPCAFPSPSGSSPLAERARACFTRLRDRLAREARDAEREGRDEVALDALDWESILGEVEAPRWSCGVLFQVAASDAAAIEAGRYRLALNGLYAGGGLAVARLAHLHAGGGSVEDGPIAREVRERWAWLERDGARVAELSYMHGGRTANAGLRPSLFRHEIELPGDRATPGREIIPLADLSVRFESDSRRFRLRWRSRGVDVLPMVSSGISPEGWVSFLIAIGQQDLQPLALFPGFDVDGIRRWPRFRFGRVVVFRRRWSFGPDDSPVAAALKPLDPQRMLDVARWQRRHGLPRDVFAHTTADPKPFHVDLESPWSIELMGRRMAESPGTTLHVAEMLPDPEAMWIRDARGRYASEFLVHLQNVGGDSSPGAGG